MNNKNKITYFRVDFNGCPTFDFDYTICADMDGVLEYLSLVQDDLDADSETSVTITGVGMTSKEYSNWLKENIKP